MKKDSDRDIEHYISTGRLMNVLEISGSTVYRRMAKGNAEHLGGKGHRFPIQLIDSDETSLIVL
jgi:predicted DNA-binding transcriptional regulator AlpA